MSLDQPKIENIFIVQINLNFLLSFFLFILVSFTANLLCALDDKKWTDYSSSVSVFFVSKFIHLRRPYFWWWPVFFRILFRTIMKENSYISSGEDEKEKISIVYFDWCMCLYVFCVFSFSNNDPHIDPSFKIRIIIIYNINTNQKGKKSFLLSAYVRIILFLVLFFHWNDSFIYQSSSDMSVNVIGWWNVVNEWMNERTNEKIYLEF